MVASSLADLAGKNFNPQSVELIALDIDGTLLAPGVDHRALPDERISKVIKRLMQSGVEVLLASGRMFPGTKHIADHLGITRPLICQQGASIHELNGELLHRFTIDQSIAREIAQLALDEGWPYAWFDAERYLVDKLTEASQYFADVSGIDVETHPSPRDSGLIATGVDIISDRNSANGIYQRLAQRFGDKIELLDFMSVTAAHSRDANKGKALELVAGELKITADNSVAIGDSVNDISMLRWAGFGASPEHCDDYAREATDSVLEGSGVAGVAALLETIADGQ